MTNREELEALVEGKVSDMWEYHGELKERQLEAMKEGDDIGAAYYSGQQSGLIHGVDVLESFADELEEVLDE